MPQLRQGKPPRPDGFGGPGKSLNHVLRGVAIAHASCTIRSLFFTQSEHTLMELPTAKSPLMQGEESGN